MSNMNPGQDKHRLLIDLPDAFAYHQIVSDSNGKPVDYIFLDANPAFYEMTGFPPDQTIGKRITELQPEIKETDFDWIGTYGRIALTGETVRFEQYSEMAERWYGVTAYSDNPGFFAVVFRDITKWKHMEDKIRRSERLLNESQAISKTGGWVYNVKNQQITWTDEVYRIYGVTKDYDPSNVSEDISFYSTADQKLIEKAFWDAVNKGVPYDLELRFTSADGTAKWVRTIGKPLLENGAVTKVIGNIMDITDHKETEESLKDYKAELAAIYENAPITMMLVDINHKVVKINGYTASFFAKPLEEMIGKRGGEALGCLYALDTPEGCSYGPRCNECTIRNTVLDTMETGKNYHQVETSRSFIIAGQEKELFFLLSTIKVSVKNQTMVLVCLQHITERKKAEENLKESEERLSIILENLPGGVFAHDLDGRFLFVNNMASRYTGYTKEELLKMTVGDIDSGSIGKEERVQLWHSLALGESIYFESKHTRKNGSQYPVEVYLNAIKIHGKSVILPITLDISERKQAEMSLRRREEEFRALAENAPDMVVRIDRKLRYLYANPALEKETGISRDQYIGKTNLEIGLPPEVAKYRDEAVIEVFRSGKEKELYFDHMHPSGRKYYHSRIVPEYAPDGSVETVLAIIRDITAIKEMEAALYQERARTSELHRRALPDELPVVPGLALAANYKSAATLQGDYCNVIKRHNQQLLYLVDVDASRDDGVMESLYVRKAIEDYLQAHADDTPVSPTLLLHYLADRYHQDTQAETIPLCVFIAVFENQPADGSGSRTTPADSYHPETLRYASTNFRTPPLIIKEGSDPDELALENLYLAMDNGTDPLEHTLTIVPGSTFVFSTDGLFNQGPDAESYELRLRELLKKQAHLPPEMISQAVETDFTEFYSDYPLQNDLAFIVVQVPKQEQCLSYRVESEFQQISAAKDKVSSLLAKQLGHEPNLLHFHELLVNAVEHGNKRDGGKTVSIDLTVTDCYYKVIITDQGEGFNWRDKINKELDLEGGSERGRGIIMTRMMTDYLAYNERGNRVTMVNLLR